MPGRTRTKITRTRNFIATALTFALAFATTLSHATDLPPSWNDGKAKHSIVAWVEKVTAASSPDFVPDHASQHRYHISYPRNKTTV